MCTNLISHGFFTDEVSDRVGLAGVHGIFEANEEHSLWNDSLHAKNDDRL